MKWVPTWSKNFLKVPISNLTGNKIGATTLSMATLSIVTFCIVALSTMPFSKVTLSIATLKRLHYKTLTVIVAVS